MNLKAKLAKIERELTDTSQCPKCRGEGWPQVIVRREDEPEPEMGCPVCGRDPRQVKHIILIDRRKRAKPARSAAAGECPFSRPR